MPAHLNGDEKNWLIVRKKDDAERLRHARRARTGRCSRRWPRTCRAGPAGTFEVKWDGYRAIATVSQSDVVLTSRNGNDLTTRFEQRSRKEIAKAVKTPDCVLDGEVCALDDEGRSSFSAMQQGKAGTPLVYYAFDLLELEGEPLVELPLVERRKRLEALLDRRNRTVRLSETFDDGQALAGSRQGAAARGHRRQAPRLKVRAGQTHARLAEDQDARRAGVRHRRLHEGHGSSRVELRLARARLLRRATSSSMRATSEPASTARRSTSCSRSSGR